jgi:hypothetical protein
MKELIEEFIKEFCTEYYEMPDHALELLMDDHKCIEWEGVEYFMPENCSSYTKDDDIIWKFLNECYHV